MLWQGAKWRILKNFNVQNEECHNYASSWGDKSFDEEWVDEESDLSGMPISRYVAFNLCGSMSLESRIFYAIPNPEDLNNIPSIVGYYIINKKCQNACI